MKLDWRKAMAQFDPWFHLAAPGRKAAKTVRETQLEQLLKDSLPDLEWIEGTSKTCAKRRELLERIKAEVQG